MMDEAYNMERPKKGVDLSYDPEKHSKNVLVVVMSHKRIKQLEIIQSDSKSIIPHQGFAYD